MQLGKKPRKGNQIEIDPEYRCKEFTFDSINCFKSVYQKDKKLAARNLHLIL